MCTGSFLVVCTCLISAWQALAVPAQSWTTSTEGREVIEWAVGHGAKANVYVMNTPNRGRTSVASRDLEPGDIILSLPESLQYVIEGKDQHKDSWQLLEDMRNPDHKHRVFFDSLPAKGSIWTLPTIPRSYWPLLQSAHLEAELKELHDWFEDTWAALKDQVKAHLGQEVEYDDIMHARALMDTRQWGVPGEDYYVLLPVADLANHRQGCKNTMALEPCDSTNPQNHEKCWIWTAQERVAAGQEVCISYNHLTQDMALLQFGFLQDGPTASELSAVDRHDFHLRRAFQSIHSEQPADFKGTPQEIEQEVARLQLLLEGLKGMSAQLKMNSAEAHPRDKNASYLWKILFWRKQREQAVTREINRLKATLKR